MTAQASVRERADLMAGLIEQRLGIRGKGLEAKLRHAGRTLPRSLRRDGRTIVAALALSGNPKLRRQIDRHGLDRAFRHCEKWLDNVDPRKRRKDRILGFLAVNAANFLLICGAFIGYLVWSGRI